ncbi:MAG TPA: universal stress protein [Candidatus Kapabacteria bacterium]|nr:universal stress protein [Candidatus Kapabacteria bacterium]
MIRIKRLLAPIDFSESSKQALHYAVEFARSFKAELHLLNVIEPVMYPAEMFGQVGMVDVESVLEKSANEEMQAWRTSLIPQDVPAVVETLHGRPFAEILRYAEEHEIDLIIIGTHGRSGLDHFLLGSTAEKVVRKAPCPVLTVRPSEREIVS